MMNAEFFIGIGSGLSWLSWAIGTPTALISGFSYPLSEFADCERIFNPDQNVCNGCFNRHWLNPGDWEWCPDHKDTPRHFECSKTITTEMVIDGIKHYLPEEQQKVEEVIEVNDAIAVEEVIEEIQKEVKVAYKRTVRQIDENLAGRMFEKFLSSLRK